MPKSRTESFRGVDLLKKMKEVKWTAIVPAAGSGRRLEEKLGAGILKPFLPLGGIPILIRTLGQLDAVPEIREIIVACDPSYRKKVKTLIRIYRIRKARKVVAGGKTRTDSVYNALRKVRPSCRAVLIHDGVRPFISSGTIQKAIRRFGKDSCSGWVVGRPAVPTIKQVQDGRIEKTLNRSLLWEIETPQLFGKKVLLEAYRYFFRQKQKATDDASLVEMIGKPVKVFCCEEENMKITTAEDYRKAQSWFALPEIRVGTGEDRHALEAGRPLYLGGLKIPSPKGARAHSDGDVLLHALVDALLGALGLGDIGEFFPDHDPKFRNVRSEKFLKKVLALVRGKGFEIVNVDSTITLEAPKLSPWKKKIQENVARLIDAEPLTVGVKAKTAERMGPEGEGLALSASVVVSLRRKIP